MKKGDIFPGAFQAFVFMRKTCVTHLRRLTCVVSGYFGQGRLGGDGRKYAGSCVVDISFWLVPSDLFLFVESCYIGAVFVREMEVR